MEYRRLGKSELNVSVIGMGTWPLGERNWGPIDEADGIATIHKAIDCGINLIDTAPVYGDGRSEEVVGKAIKGNRQRLVIATKCGITWTGVTTGKNPKPIKNDLTPKAVRKEVEASLKRLDTDVIDLYQCHWPDPDTPIEDTMAEMVKLKAEGKIRYIAVSNFDVDLVQRAQKVTPIVSNQVHYSMINRDIEKELVPFCLEKDVGIVAYGPLAGGLLTGKYKEKPKLDKFDARIITYDYYAEPYWSKVQTLLKDIEKVATRYNKPLGQVAINWARQQPGITIALVGARSPTQAEANAAAGSWRLSTEDLAGLRKAITQALD